MYTLRGQEINFQWSRITIQSHSHNKLHQIATSETSVIRAAIKPGLSEALIQGTSSPGVLRLRRIPYVNSSPKCVINTWFNCKVEALCRFLTLLLNFGAPTVEKSAVLEFVRTTHTCYFSGWRGRAGWGDTSRTYLKGVLQLVSTAWSFFKIIVGLWVSSHENLIIFLFLRDFLMYFTPYTYLDSI